MGCLGYFGKRPLAEIEQEEASGADEAAPTGKLTQEQVLKILARRRLERLQAKVEESVGPEACDPVPGYHLDRK